MYDVVNALKFRIDSYVRLSLLVRARSDEFFEDGDLASYQFERGQQFTLDYVLSDLREVVQRFESSHE